jgi:hypothetical protein
MTVTFKKDKETKNKVRFANQEGDVVGTIYLDLNNAKDLTEITVEVKEA